MYVRMYGDFPAKNTVFTPYIPECMVLANPSFVLMTVRDHRSLTSPGT
jgi:hypothetical protein